ncbi:hypothetical protein DACRYDRAFT_23915 [Dacryopinax primogenitus]|uniref:Uncharacterized protein n=1 Tax=Dacryopinax primogenitus (strain DJM 731) TaxID=1858805 RepID=M5FQV2_DACPD|nr:uncharacterized protein DACRYDRAFT_23915 [Dacryopinax primogenitus]EJT99360.1 hypothetical protein DACRYDRAFT_23915 [Dacryopinax primogenitus]
MGYRRHASLRETRTSTSDWIINTKRFEDRGKDQVSIFIASVSLSRLIAGCRPVGSVISNEVQLNRLMVSFIFCRRRRPMLANSREKPCVSAEIAGA